MRAINGELVGSRTKPTEVTSEMRQAGARVIEHLSGVVDSEYLASEAYTAMASVRDAAGRRRNS